MMKNNISTFIESLNDEINAIKSDFITNIKPRLQADTSKFLEIDNCIDTVLQWSSHSHINNIVTLNIGGTIFQTSPLTLLSIKDTIFYQYTYYLYLKNNKDINLIFNREWFFDRSPETFGLILNYFRNKIIDYHLWPLSYLIKLRDEAEYYNITDILCYLNSRPLKLEIISYTSSPFYSMNGVIAGTNKLSDWNTKDWNTGFALNYPGEIVFELNYEWNIRDIIFAKLFAPKTNFNYSLYNCMILVSNNKSNWRKVKLLPKINEEDYVRIDIVERNVKYIKFSPGSVFGISYLKIGVD